MKFRADDTKGTFDVSLELAEEEKGSLEDVITNLSVGLAGVVTELLHSYCSTREEAQRLAALVLREQQSALELYTDKFFAGEDDEEEEQRLYHSMEEIYEEAWFKNSGYESEEALLAAYAGQTPLRLDCRVEENGQATVFVTNREKTEVLGQVDTAHDSHHHSHHSQHDSHDALHLILRHCISPHLCSSGLMPLIARPKSASLASGGRISTS